MTESPEGPGSAPVLLLELLESSGPLPPRFQYRTRIRVLRRGEAVLVDWEHQDAQGSREGAYALPTPRLQALKAVLLQALPPGTCLDRTAGFRDRKGISFNSLTTAWDGPPSRLDYLLSDLEEPGGDPIVRAAVLAIKGLMGGPG